MPRILQKRLTLFLLQTVTSSPVKRKRLRQKRKRRLIVPKAQNRKRIAVPQSSRQAYRKVTPKQQRFPIRLTTARQCYRHFGIQGWKLEMMAEQVFDRYIENADKVMDLSYAMLEKHIADQEELPDNTDVIRRKQGEIEKLMNKRTNLIEMRAEGDIDKELFRSKKQEIEDRVAKLTEEIKGLQPEKEQTSNEDYSVKLLELRERLKEYTGFDYSVIPESIVEAFIERIWVSKDEFRWYLRTGNNADSEFDPDDHIKIGAFTLTIDDAKKYIYSFSTRRRVYKWSDLNVSVWI